MVNSSAVTTLTTPKGFILCPESLDHTFDPDCFNAARLAEIGVLQGTADAGRGNTFFFKWKQQHLVLRHYRRGGLIRHFNSDSYWYSGAKRTRAVREFQMLLYLCGQELPVSRPYACRVDKKGLFYSASLITYRLPGKTLAEKLLADGCLSLQAEHDVRLWRKVGEVIARFHAQGIYHADLNAHNIMLDEHGGIALIDFDRARIRSVPTKSGWPFQNMLRFERSLKKIVRSQDKPRLTEELMSEYFSVCFNEWENHWFHTASNNLK